MKTPLKQAFRLEIWGVSLLKSQYNFASFLDSCSISLAGLHKRFVILRKLAPIPRRRAVR